MWKARRSHSSFAGTKGKPERFGELAADLVRLKVDVIVAGTSAAIPAAKQATTTIPGVMTTAISNPVESGWIASLARPGANITGMTLIAAGLSAKRLELLKEAVPGASRVAALWNPKHGPGPNLLRETEAAARTLGVRIQPLEVVNADQFESAFRAANQGGARAVITIQNPLFSLHRARIADLGIKYRLATLSSETGFAQAGGLMHYGPDPTSNWRSI